MAEPHGEPLACKAGKPGRRCQDAFHTLSVKQEGKPGPPRSEALYSLLGELRMISRLHQAWSHTGVGVEREREESEEAEAKAEIAHLPSLSPGNTPPTPARPASHASFRGI